MNKIVFWLLVALFVGLYNFALDVDVTKLVPAHPYDRCMNLYEGTDREFECTYLK